VGKNLLYEFLDAIETIYLMIILKKYDDSIVKQELAEKKAYCIDNGLLNAVTFRFHRDTGKLLENLIAVELLKKEKSIFFYRNRVECDFIVTEKDRVSSAVQVCLSLSDPDTRRREIRGLVSACERFLPVPLFFHIFSRTLLLEQIRMCPGSDKGNCTFFYIIN
jgi:predicted AAA+ superfamily ATPase